MNQRIEMEIDKATVRRRHGAPSTVRTLKTIERSSFGGDARRLFVHRRIRNVQPQRRNDGRDQRESRKRIEPGGETTGRVFRPADDRRRKKAAEIADGVDPGATGSR